MDAYSYSYFVLGIFVLVAIVFPIAPILISKLVAPKKPSTMKQDTYECGLEAKGDAWIAMKPQYYVYALAFVAFDLEAPFVYAWAVVFKTLPGWVFVEMIVFLAILVAGLVYAWRKGALEWH